MLESPETMAKIVVELRAITKNPVGYHCADDALCTILMNHHWAYPHQWFCIWTDTYKHEWRITEKGQKLLASAPTKQAGKKV